MSLIDYEPMKFLNRMQHEFDDFYKFNGGFPFNHSDNISELIKSEWKPSVDIKEDNKTFIVTADIPGVQTEDIQVSMNNNCLSIKGERKYENEEKKNNYHIKECANGIFERRINMPDNADENKVNAKNKNGVLTITISKKQSSKPRIIEVKS